MKHYASNSAALYGPQTLKTFSGALFSFFAEECPQLGGDRTRRILVESVCDLVAQFHPAADGLTAGQTVWTTVHKDARGGYGKHIEDTRLVSVILDLVGVDDAADRANGKRLREVKKEAVARLCLQADRQQGCLTAAELAVLLKISPGGVSAYIAEWEREHQTVLPRRGTIHDLGPSLTHKKTIIHKLFIEHKSVQQTARETNHSPGSIQRYISTFRQILLCRQKDMATEEIAYVTKRTVRLVREYEGIIDHYAANSYVLSELLHHHPHVESNGEAWANDYQQTETLT